MRRTSKILTSGLLICALAAVTVPAGVHLAPAFLPQSPAAVAVVPAAQQMPTELAEISSVKPLVDTAPLPDPAKLAAGLQKALAYDGEGTFGVHVADAATGQELFSQNGTTALTPASNLKLLTAAAALHTLGADSRFPTRVVAGAAANEVVVVAGGDAMLGEGAGKAEQAMGHAGLADLAREAAGRLTAADVAGPVTVTIDDSLFTGPALNPSWADGDVEMGEIAPIYPMALHAGRLMPEVLSGPRPQDSAVAVAEAFARALETAGVATFGPITRGAAPALVDGVAGGDPADGGDPGADAAAPSRALPAGTMLGEVLSATVAEQTQYMLAESDNYVAEVLARMAAAKLGREASNTGSVAAVRQVAAGLGLPMDGITTTDNCGLAVGNLISPAKLAQLVGIMVSAPASDMGHSLPGLPIAGLSGSLAERFDKAPQLAGAGLVRAKTGSLNSVSSLSGYVINSQGRLLVFSIIGNGLTDGGAAARPVVDAAAAVLAQS